MADELAVAVDGLKRVRPGVEPKAPPALVRSNRWQRIVLSVQRHCCVALVEGRRATEDEDIFTAEDGSHALPHAGLLLFAGPLPEHMPGGVCLRLVRLVADTAFTDEAARAHNSANRTLDLRTLRLQSDQRRLLSQLCLAPLKLSPKPLPIWLHTTFLAEFGDPFIEQTVRSTGRVGSARVQLRYRLFSDIY